MRNQMSKTAALYVASRAVSNPIGKHTSWVVVGPYDYNDPDGPYTEVGADDYFKARECAARWKAKIALSLMGELTDHAEYMIEDADGGTVAQLLAIGLATARDPAYSDAD